MDPHDEALYVAVSTLELLNLHHSQWVKKVVVKTMERINELVDDETKERLAAEYRETWRKR